MEADPGDVIRRYARGQSVHTSDLTLADAFFLDNHPTWSQRDLDEADQDVLDHLAAIARESGAVAREKNLQAAREQAAAVHRSRLGGRRG